MTDRGGLQRIAKLVVAGGALLGVTGLLCRPALPQSSDLRASDFVQIAPQGFGDRQNTAAWAMTWWRDNLYVGTVRAWYCWGAVWFHEKVPFFPYPPKDPDIDCAADPTDLPLQAEVWRYTPATATWKRVYQSPNDVPIPGHPGKFTARDVGFRTMTVFTEADGTEALYVGGTTINVLWPPLPPPRILRSTDGETFTPVPQDPGTVLGNPPEMGGYRSMAVLNGRLYTVNGKIRGEGVVLEAADPAGGNNNFRQITPPGIQAYAVAAFNGFLYVGVFNPGHGYSVLKTDATGTPPYHFIPIVTHGGFLPLGSSKSVVTMHVFNNRLYVGMDQPAELIRINPDDSWDLVLGQPRLAPTGMKQPLSGLGAGFDWPLNVHIWQMQGHEGTLHVGTLDNATRAKVVPGMEQAIGNQFGFDFYRSSDDFYFTPVSTNGLGDMFQFGLRSFASTSQGLFVGGVDIWHGLRVWQGVPTPRSLEPPERVTLEQRTPSKPPGWQGSGTSVMLLSWDAPAGASRFHIFRAEVLSDGLLDVPGLDPSAMTTGPTQEIGTTTDSVFLDQTVRPRKRYHYMVVAEDGSGTMSAPSNLVRGPSLVSPVTFQSIENTILDWAGRSGLGLVLQLQTAADTLTQGSQFDTAVQDLEQVLKTVQDAPGLLPAWRVADLQILLAQLTRRIDLAKGGFISVNDLL